MTYKVNTKDNNKIKSFDITDITPIEMLTITQALFVLSIDETQRDKNRQDAKDMLDRLNVRNAERGGE